MQRRGTRRALCGVEHGAMSGARMRSGGGGVGRPGRMRPRVGVGFWLLARLGNAVAAAWLGQGTGGAGQREERGAGQAAAPVGPSRPPARERARSRGARLGWFGYLGQMPLFFFLCLLFLFFFLFLSYSMPWVSHIGIHVLPTRIPPSVVL